MKQYQYIESPETAAYCEKIGHVFSPLEMAVIIARNHKMTLGERHTAWKEIMDDYPDMPIPASPGFEAEDSLHAYLRALIALEERAVKDFLTPKEGYVYQYTACWSSDATGEGKSVQGLDCFTTYPRAWAAFCERWDWEKDAVTYAAFAKNKLDTRDRLSITVNANQDVLWVFCYFSSEPEYGNMQDLLAYEIHLPFDDTRNAV